MESLWVLKYLQIIDNKLFHFLVIRIMVFNSKMHKNIDTSIVNPLKRNKQEYLMTYFFNYAPQFLKKTL